jgi:CDP-diacylglycerol--glycerol-3-phosphate 3-phosphatidyltransferase
VERLYLLAPALSLLAITIAGLAAFGMLTVLGRQPQVRGAKHNDLFGEFFGRWLVWMLTPVERVLVGRVSANAITTLSLLLCIVAGVGAATGHLVVATWTFITAGILDALDGRIARLSGEQSKAGALFDSVSDRWGELAAFTGYVWFLRESPWLFAAMGAIGGSMMVSYTRARAEGLGVDLRGGMMQRAERMVLVCLGTLVAAWFAAVGDYATAIPIIGVTLSICAVASTATAISRWVQAYRVLAERATKRKVVEAPAPATTTSTGPMFPVPAKLRESAELGL